MRAVNNLSYNEPANTYFKCNNILKLSAQYKLQVSNYILQVLHSNIDVEIESSLLINNQIHSPNTKWVFYASTDLKQNIMSFTMVW